MKIAIVGAGIGGLTLANFLQRQGLQATIYERDEHSESRAQGSVVTLRKPAGLAVLKDLGLYDAIKEVSVPAVAFSIVTPNGTRLMNLEAPTPEVDQYSLGVPREQLHRFLLANLTQDQVVWNAKCVGFEVSAQ